MKNLKRSASPGSDTNRQKRVNIADSDDDEVMVRLMIPASVAGAVIGKKGETLKQIKNEVGCSIKMSRNEDGMYPTTMERVLNARGRVSAVGRLMGIVIEKVADKLDQQHAPDQFDHKNTPRQQEMKFIVPNTSAGMVIGKSGASIKEIRDKTGVSVQVFPKAGTLEAQRSVERIITVSSPNPSDLEMACVDIVRRIAGDPQHDQGPEFFNPAMTASGQQGGGPGGHGPMGGGPSGYGGPGGPGGRGGPMDGPPGGGGPFGGGPPGGFGGPMGGGGPGGPQQQGQGGPPSMFPPSQPPPQQQSRFDPDTSRPPSMFGSVGGGPQMLTQPGFKFNPMEGVGNSEVLQFLDSLQMTLRSSGFNEQAVSEIMSSMQVLAKYNLMGLGLGLGVAAMATLRGQGAVPPNSAAGLTSATSTPQQQTSQAPPPVQQQQQHDTGSLLTSQQPPSLAAAPGDSFSSLQPQQQQQLGSLSSYTPQSQAPPPSQQQQQQSLQQPPQQQQQEQNNAGNQQSGHSNFAASVIKTRMQVDPNKLELEIPAPIVTAVMPAGGKTLENIQRFSGTLIDAAKRANDPTFRIVTISGETDSVRAAKVMIERAINEEQARRQRMSAF